MENITESSKNTFTFNQKTWLADAVINGILSATSFYILLALLFHKIKIEKRLKEAFLRLSPERRYKKISSYLCILIAAASLIVNANAFGRKLFERNAVYANFLTTSQKIALETICQIIPPLGNAAITAASGTTYTFLWIRQRIIYIQPSLKTLSNMYIECFSLGIMTLWLLFIVSLYVAFFSLVHYTFFKELGCVVEEFSIVAYGDLIEAFTITSILMQVTLLVLFIYPILKRTLWKNEQPENHTFFLLRRVKKAVILTSICLGSDILAAVVTTILLEKNSSSIIFPFGVNSVVNLLVTIFCFDHWKKLLWPWTLKQVTAFQTLSFVSNQPTRNLNTNLDVTDGSPISA